MENAVDSSLLSVTTTAMLRPELLSRAYSSFQRHLRDVDLKDLVLHLNVDPAPVGHAASDEVVSAAERFFGKVVSHCPEEPNFTAAINWLWSQADTPFILHLEDDWEMCSDGWMADVLQAFKDYPRIYQVRFVGRISGSTPFQVALAPGVIRREFYSRVAGRLDESVNPEIQLHTPGFWDKCGIEHAHRCAAMYAPRKGLRLVRDIGRTWAAARSIVKRGPKFRFTRWG